MAPERMQGASPAALEADQYAALGWRMREDQPEYLLVTSRRTRRWIFPKGSAEPGERPADAALREAVEEAGVAGRPGTEPIGRYSAFKVSARSERLLTVELWPVEVTGLAAEYPERGLRERRMVDIATARRLVGQEDMVALIERFHAGLTGG